MFKYFLAAGAVLILGMVALDYLQPMALELEAHRLKLIVIGLAFGVAAFLRFQGETAHETGFMEWLSRNQREVRAGVGDYHGKRIGPKTMMVRYAWVMSPIRATFAKATDHYVLGSPEAKVAKIYCMLVTALLGWWHYRGLMATPQVLKQNWRDSNAVSVAELLESITTS
ncbi:MAG: hypothetical protein ACT4PK_00615 [Gammaproteobacteria bacterium]